MPKFQGILFSWIGNVGCSQKQVVRIEGLHDTFCGLNFRGSEAISENCKHHAPQKFGAVRYILPCTNKIQDGIIEKNPRKQVKTHVFVCVHVLLLNSG